jgi:hypothetical protein
VLEPDLKSVTLLSIGVGNYADIRLQLLFIFILSE